MDDAKVVEAVEWIERAAQSSKLLDRYRNAMRHRARLLSEDEWAEFKSELHPFTSCYLGCAVARQVNGEAETIEASPRWKVIVGLVIPVKTWQNLVGLNEEEVALFRSYVPAIPNDWYSVVEIKMVDGVEVICVEQHHFLPREESEKLADAARRLTNALVTSGHPALPRSNP